MSTSQPTATLPPPTTTTPLLTTTAGAPALSDPVASSAWTPPGFATVVFTPEEMTTALRELGQAVAGIRTFLEGPYP